ncbi:DM13 domain-containing protein [Terrabacter sp. Ter38]|nr:DM13 domain-containing protein [Terrabacter sp. Ter38]
MADRPAGATDGNQNYAVPAGTDLSDLTSVVIWCDRFDVAFGSAPIRST